jgi:hypothetical protein
MIVFPSMRHILFATALFAAAASVAGCSKSDTAQADKKSDKKAEDFPSMTVDEVDKAVSSKEATAVDCNHPKLRQEKGVVPGAILVSSTSFDAKEMPADKAAKLIFYCADPG